ncbi:photosystem II cytochrome PsbV2 [Geitlerinema sp. PCC 9228]|jgi:photosystem II cytochrome c550|uniref:photosystem II cytochrome PsbV2 n=1 Tax=Geitlerinema sp. PCC 9228 TaxID=111611 RepID=UPI0008F9BF23|nr:photosystem II cytochrome PsbV2 [Geitlerinema sp. PCC 9228]
MFFQKISVPTGWSSAIAVKLSIFVGTAVAFFLTALPAQAASIDAYVKQYLRATAPVEIPYNAQGETREFSPQALSDGKKLFEENCLNCHVGGSTLPNPRVSLSLEDLQGASPPRDNIDNLVVYMRQPMTYDGQYASDWCRKVPDTWMSRQQVENLAAFILRAAEKAPGWGVDTFGDSPF